MNYAIALAYSLTIVAPSLPSLGSSIIAVTVNSANLCADNDKDAGEVGENGIGLPTIGGVH